MPSSLLLQTTLGSNVNLPTRSIRSGLAVLSRLSSQDIDWILDFGIETELAPRTNLLTEGFRPDAISLIARGLLNVFLGSDPTNPIAVLGPGHLVGEMSFIEDRPASASAVAIEPCTILSLPTQLLHSKLENDPEFAARLFRSLAQFESQRLRELLGEFERWVQEIPPTPLVSSTLYLELAEATQRCKESMIAAWKQAHDQAGRAVAMQLREFASLMTMIVGPDSTTPPDLCDELGARVKRELLPVLRRSALASRLYEKPTGYELDYETMELIGSEMRIEKCPVSMALRRLPSLVGLWNREYLLADVLRERVAEHSGNPIGCSILADHTGNIVLSALSQTDVSDLFEVTLLDFDKKALVRVNERVAVAGFSSHFTSVDPHLLALIAGRFEVGAQSSIIVCSGALADALEECFLLRVINRLYDLMAPEGCLIMGFYATGQSDWSLFHHVLDVTLIQHTEGEVNRLFSRSKFQSPPTRVRYEKEHTCFVTECRKGSGL